MKPLMIVVLFLPWIMAFVVGVPDAHARSDLSRKCALASDLIRENRCGPDPTACDRGLYEALKAGCRIHSWGHQPEPPPQ